MIFKKSFSILFLLVVTSVSAYGAKNILPFSEETEFLSKEENAMIDFNKVDAFLGIITRTQVQSSDQKTLDLYKFSKVKIKRINTENCQTLADSVFGPSDKIDLKTVTKEVFKSPRNGDICEIVLKDEDKDEKFKERRFFAFISKEQVYGIVSRFNKAASEEQSEDLRKFIRGLKQP